MRIVFALTLGLILGGCHHAQVNSAASAPPKEAMTNVKLQPMCIGRLVIDVPVAGQWQWQQQFDRAEVVRLGPIASRGEFEALVARRRTELQRPADQLPQGRIGLEKHAENWHIFLLRDNGVPETVFLSERYLWLPPSLYRYETGALLDSQAIALIPFMEERFSHLVAFDNHNTDAGDGFCIDSALVVGGTGPIKVNAIVDLAQMQGVSLAYGTSEDDGTSPPRPWERSSALHINDSFEDLKEAEAIANAGKRGEGDDKVKAFTIVRRNRRTVDGIAGQEIAYLKQFASGQAYYYFEWQSATGERGPSALQVTVQMMAGRDTGEPQSATLPPRAELEALWEATLSSVHRRGRVAD